MSLKEALEAQSRKSFTCRVRDLLESLNEEDKKALEEAFVLVLDGWKTSKYRSRYSVNWIIDSLAQEGHRMNKDHISKHLNMKCSCYLP